MTTLWEMTAKAIRDFAPRPHIRVGKITDEEYEKITKEMYERHLDILSHNYHERVKRHFSKSELEAMKATDTVGFNFSFDMIGNDIIQMVGAIRRGR